LRCVLVKRTRFASARGPSQYIPVGRVGNLSDARSLRGLFAAEAASSRGTKPVTRRPRFALED
jgi:hypothetical protein